MGNSKKSESLLLKGLELHPYASKLSYALAYLYLQNGDSRSAQKYGRITFGIEPQNPAYQELYRKLQII